jgi:3-oxoacyl-[acyl-carrier protein] reductase
MMLCHIEMMRLTVDGMMARGFGRIVNITSRSVKNPADRTRAVERGASRVGGFRRLDWHADSGANVTINNLLPGPFDTDAQREHVQGMVDASNSFDRSGSARRAERRRPLRQPDELGAYCAFLCSAQAGFITARTC